MKKRIERRKRLEAIVNTWSTTKLVREYIRLKLVKCFEIFKSKSYYVGKQS